MPRREKWHQRGPPLVRWERGLPKLVLWPRYERPVRWSLRLATAAGILVALVNLPTGPDFAVAVILAALDWFLERSIFLFTALHVTPLPHFEYDSKQWESMAYLFLGSPDEPDSTPYAVGLVFHDEEYATRFFELLRAWNSGENDDTRNNVCLSLITDEDRYFVLLSPSFSRPDVRRSWRDLRSAARRADKKREPFLITMSMVICKEFSAMAGYSLGRFVDKYRQGRPFDLVPLLHGPEEILPIPTIAPIRKYHLKAKTRSYLKTDEFEYVHLARLGL